MTEAPPVMKDLASVDSKLNTANFIMTFNLSGITASCRKILQFVDY